MGTLLVVVAFYDAMGITEGYLDHDRLEDFSCDGTGTSRRSNVRGCACVVALRHCSEIRRSNYSRGECLAPTSRIREDTMSASELKAAVQTESKLGFLSDCFGGKKRTLERYTPGNNTRVIDKIDSAKGAN
jgi:hypothetical protein